MPKKILTLCDDHGRTFRQTREMPDGSLEFKVSFRGVRAASSGEQEHRTRRLAFPDGALLRLFSCPRKKTWGTVVVNRVVAFAPSNRVAVVTVRVITRL